MRPFINHFFDEPLVLLAEDGGHFETPERGIAYRIDGKTWVNNHAHILRPKESIDLNFLCRVLEHYDVTPFVTGTTRGKLTKAGASEIPIPLPPIAEQRRIATILDKADAIRYKRQQALALADGFLRSAFLEIFGDPVSNSRGWHVAPLEALINPTRPITYGILMPGPDIQDGVPYIRVVDMEDGAIKLGQVRRTTASIANEYKRSKLQSGDLLISIRGHVGRLAIVPKSLDGSNITQDTARLAVASEAVCSHYLLRCLETTSMQAYMHRFVRGAAVKGLNLGDLKKLEIPVPTPGLQARFTRISAAHLAKKDKLKRATEEADHMFASLSQRAFRGDL